MQRQNSRSLIYAGCALMLMIGLGACTPGGQFDPTEAVSSDIFNTKKKIQGEREPLFPQGVPGTETGVPADLVKGYQPPPEPPAVTADAAPKAETAAAKPKPKAKPKRKVARAPAPASDPAFNQKPASLLAPPQQSTQPAWPNTPAPTAATNWPAPPPTGQAEKPASATAATNWPAPPPTGQAQKPASATAETNWPAPPQPQTQTNWPAPTALGQSH
jgi:hypothetical protein